MTTDKPCPAHGVLGCNCESGREQRLRLNADVPGVRVPEVVSDEAGMLRVKLRETGPGSLISGSGNDFATALVVAEHAERAAFARQALAVKLRELDAACTERDRFMSLAHGLTKECRDLAVHCERFDADLDAAINGQLRRAK